MRLAGGGGVWQHGRKLLVELPVGQQAVHSGDLFCFGLEVVDRFLVKCGGFRFQVGGLGGPVILAEAPGLVQL